MLSFQLFSFPRSHPQRLCQMTAPSMKMVQPEVSSRLTGIFPSDSHQMQFTGNGQIVGVFPLILWGLPYNIKQLEVSVVVNSYYVNKIEFSSPAVIECVQPGQITRLVDVLTQRDRHRITN